MGCDDSMKDLLARMEKADKSILWCDLNSKLNRLSRAVMLALNTIELYEYDPLKKGACSTIIDLKEILEGTV